LDSVFLAEKRNPIRSSIKIYPLGWIQGVVIITYKFKKSTEASYLFGNYPSTHKTT